MPKPKQKKPKTSANQQRLTRINAQLPFAGLTPPTPPRPTTTEAQTIASVGQKKAEKRQLRKDARRDKRASRAAAQMLRRGLAHAISELPADLTGPERDRTVKEFLSRQVDAISGSKLEQRGITTKFREARDEIQGEIGEAKVAKQTILGNLAAEAEADRASYAGDVAQAQLESEKAQITGDMKGEGEKVDNALTPTQMRARKAGRKAAAITIAAALRKAREDEEKFKAITEDPDAFLIAAVKNSEGFTLGEARWAWQQMKKNARRLKQRQAVSGADPNVIYAP